MQNETPSRPTTTTNRLLLGIGQDWENISIEKGEDWHISKTSPLYQMEDKGKEGKRLKGGE